MNSSLDAAVVTLERGGVVVYPTETLYGLGADATSASAVERVAALKERDATKPILVIVSSRAMLSSVVATVPDEAERLIARFWPGPLTLVLPARSGLPAPLTAGGRSIGVRIPGHALARELAARLGRPITSTSANPGGWAPARDVTAARAYFGPRVDVYLDGGPSSAGPGSTVLDLSGTKAVLVREGAIPAVDLGVELA